MGKQGVGLTLGGENGQDSSWLSCLLLTSGSPAAPPRHLGRVNGEVGVGWGRASPSTCVGWVLLASARRSWYRNVLASGSCRKRRCQMLFMPPGTSSHLFCAP